MAKRKRGRFSMAAQTSLFDDSASKAWMGVDFHFHRKTWSTAVQAGRYRSALGF